MRARKCSFCGRSDSWIVAMRDGNNKAVICERCLQFASECLEKVRKMKARNESFINFVANINVSGWDKMRVVGTDAVRKKNI